jgi:hypothetical protein
MSGLTLLPLVYEAVCISLAVVRVYGIFRRMSTEVTIFSWESVWRELPFCQSSSKVVVFCEKVSADCSMQVNMEFAGIFLTMGITLGTLLLAPHEWCHLGAFGEQVVPLWQLIYGLRYDYASELCLAPELAWHLGLAS